LAAPVGAMVTPRVWSVAVRVMLPDSDRALGEC
jgi:hypothetical protein